MQKTAAFYIISSLFLGGCAAVAAFWNVLAALPLLIILLWWTLFFKSIHYHIDGDRLTILSGVLLKSEKIIPLSNILWKTSVKFPFSDTSALTIIHTCGGKWAIFGEFSTRC